MNKQLPLPKNNSDLLILIEYSDGPYYLNYHIGYYDSINDRWKLKVLDTYIRLPEYCKIINWQEIPDTMRMECLRNGGSSVMVFEPDIAISERCPACGLCCMGMCYSIE